MEITGHPIHWFIFYQRSHNSIKKKECILYGVLCPLFHFWLKYPYPFMSFAHRRSHWCPSYMCDCLWTLQPSRGRINVQTLWSRAPGIFAGVPLWKCWGSFWVAQEPTRNILGEESRELRMMGRVIDLHSWPCASGSWHVSETRY